MSDGTGPVTIVVMKQASEQRMDGLMSISIDSYVIEVLDVSCDLGGALSALGSAELPPAQCMLLWQS